MSKSTKIFLRPMIVMVNLLFIGLLPVAGQAQASCGGTTETALIAGQNIPVGSVFIENDENNLYVTYQTDGSWLITETHLDVAASPDDLKQTPKGNPVPGRFAYRSEHDPGETTVTYTIDLSAWPSGSTLFLAAHSVVTSASGSETAWGEGVDFPGNNWAMYLSYDLQPCEPPPLEPGVIDMQEATVLVFENGVSATLKLIRTNGSDGPATVTLGSSDITATSGDDYEAVTTVVTFADGETEKSFQVFILDDTQVEPDEQFNVQIIDVTGADAGSNTATTCIIIDDDSGPPL